MNIVRSTALFMVLLCRTATALSQSTTDYTLAAAIHQALDHNPRIEQAVQMLNGARAKTKQSRGAWYPTAEADFNYTRLDPVSQLAFPGLGDFQLFSPNNYDEHVSVKQTIYDFGKTSASVELSDAAITAGSDNIDLVKTSIAYETIRTFYAMIFYKKSIAVQDEQISALNQHQAETRKRIAAGTATEFDTLTSRVRITIAQNKKYDLLNELEKREATFRQILGLSSEQPFQIHGDFTRAPAEFSADSLVSTANSQRLELKLSRDQIQLSQLKERTIAMTDMPVFKVNADYGLKNGFFPNMDVLRGNWVLNLNLKVPIFNGFLTRNQEEEMKASTMGLEAHTNDMERVVSNEVLQALADVRTNEKKFTTSQSQVEQATRALTFANRRYETGIVTNLDVLDAQTTLSQAELAVLDAQYNYAMSRYALDKAIGANLFGE